ncbi:hypothetical protein HDU93_002210 [Gonapodya sp. JEL0774]|nr:hypothetical protein HDU93_002210 [Gonapodya sp. JEL0774]
MLSLASNAAAINLPRAAVSRVAARHFSVLNANAPVSASQSRLPVVNKTGVNYPVHASQLAFSRAQKTAVLSARRGYASLPPHKVIDLPAMSPTMAQGNVGNWQKSVGDKITTGDVLVEIETDKAQMELEAPDDGYLAAIIIPSGAKDVPVGKPLCVVVEEESSIAAFANYEAGAAAAPPPPTPTAPAAPAQPTNPAVSAAPVKSSFPPHTVIGLPALSPTMSQGNIGQWKKKEGDAIAPGDVLVEIETDKAQMDFECQDEGYLAKILISDGTKDVLVGTPLAILITDKDDLPNFANYTSEAASAPAPAPAPAPSTSTSTPSPSATSTTVAVSAPVAHSVSVPNGGRLLVSPVAKKIAAERGIDLAQIAGTGPNGRILKSDVETFVPKPAATPVPAPTSTVPRAAPIAASPAAPHSGAVFVDIPLSQVRKIIAQRLSQSKSELPHYYVTMEVEMDKVNQLRETLNAQAVGKYKLSVNDFIIKASALALKDVPAVNSAWMGDFIRQFTNVDISVAVATESGLITPIVKGADVKGLGSISNTVKELAGRAKANKLKPDEFQGGTFTISNLGMYGVEQFTAIINPPQSAILAIGASKQKLVANESAPKGFVTVSSMNVTLSSDHRVVDGAVAAQWLNAFKKYMENPFVMLLIRDKIASLTTHHGSAESVGKRSKQPTAAQISPESVREIVAAATDVLDGVDGEIQKSSSFFITQFDTLKSGGQLTCKATTEEIAESPATTDVGLGNADDQVGLIAMFATLNYLLAVDLLGRVDEYSGFKLSGPLFTKLTSSVLFKYPPLYELQSSTGSTLANSPIAAKFAAFILNRHLQPFTPPHHLLFGSTFEITASGTFSQATAGNLVELLTASHSSVLDFRLNRLGRHLTAAIVSSYADENVAPQLIKTAREAGATGIEVALFTAAHNTVPMTPHTATVLQQGRLHPQFILEWISFLVSKGIRIDRLKRLRISGTRCDEFHLTVPSSLDLASLRSEVYGLSKVHRVDVALQPSSVFRRQRRVAVFDMDSTLIKQEVIDEIAKRTGVVDKVAKITEAAMNGEIDFKESLRRRVALLKGTPATVFEEVRKELVFTEGAKELCASLKRLGYRTAVISGGFVPLAKYVKHYLGLDYSFANTLAVSHDGRYLTGEVEGDIVDAQRKAQLLEVIAQAEEVTLDQVIAVGDGANDLPMLHKAGLGIAFNAKPKVQEQAATRINQPNLLNVLYLLGYSEDEVTQLTQSIHQYD